MPVDPEMSKYSIVSELLEPEPEEALNNNPLVPYIPVAPPPEALYVIVTSFATKLIPSDHLNV